MEQWVFHMDMMFALNMQIQFVLLKKAYEYWSNFIDSAEAYGWGDNERLVGEAFEGMRDKINISTKLHIIGESDNLAKFIEDHLDSSLKDLTTNYVDVYYMHIMLGSKKLSIEDMAKIFGDLIKKGKIKGLRNSQLTSEEIERCNEITPLTCV